MTTATKATTWHVIYTSTMQRLVGEHVESDDGTVKVLVTARDEGPDADPHLVTEMFTTYEAAHARALELWPDDDGHYGIAYLTIEKNTTPLVPDGEPEPPTERETVLTWMV